MTGLVQIGPNEAESSMMKSKTVRALDPFLQDSTLKPFFVARLTDTYSTSEASEVARNHLSLHAHHAARALRGVKMGRNEVLALLDVVRRWFITPESAQYLAVEVEDALEDGLSEKWDIDGKALVGKLSDMHPYDRAVLALTLKDAWDVKAAHDNDLERTVVALGVTVGPSKAAEYLNDGEKIDFEPKDNA